MIIGITGTDGAGKGAATRILVDHYGFSHYSSRDLITTEIEKRGLTPDRATLRLVANDLRREFGHDVIVKKAIERATVEGKNDVVIESIRALAEAATLKQVGGTLLAVDADPEIRYKRITGRGSASDTVSYEEFLAHEEIEKNDPDPNGMQKAAVIAAADFTIMNNASMHELKAAIESWYQSVTAH